MREICKSGSMRGRRKRAATYRACVLLYEAPNGLDERIESLAAKRRAESPATEQLVEEVCARENCKQALARVKANKGSAGVDGMTVHELPGFLKQHWPAIRDQLLSGTYKPQPVKRVEIPKPDGGIRKLGIPMVKANCTGAQLTFGMG
jgi:RNA-directed DNA polymerase